MPDVEDSSPIVDHDPSQRCCKALRTFLHGVLVTTLFFVIMFAYIYLYRIRYIRVDNNTGDNRYAVASLVIQLVAYLALGFLYICNSSGWQEKMISAGFLVFVQFVFLVSSIGIPVHRYHLDFVSGTNIVAIYSYCVWKFRFIILHSRLKKCARTILHVAIVIILLVVVVIIKNNKDKPDTRRLIQLVAYSAVGCLYICNSSSRKVKLISAGFLVLVLLAFLLWSSLASIAIINFRVRFIFRANIVAISSYCLWKVCPLLIDFDGPGTGAAAMAPPPPLQRAQQEEEAVLELQLQQTPFRIQDVPKEFSRDEVHSMTREFSYRNLIGRGASAQVFRGNLDDGTPVAVKRINIHGGRTVAGEEDFRRELSIIANVHHRSLVRLLGYCLQRGGGLYLVYPFFENGSLDRWIFHGTDEQRRLLTWPKRLGIAVDVARALAYLHNECHWRILHLDVKPGNILLDGDLRAHVSDFGISLSITRGLDSVVDTEHLKGTFGYMAPEMLYNAVSDKSGFFSYGMTLLELVGGRRNMYPSLDTPDLMRDYFPYIVREKVKRGEVLEAVDAAMAPVGDEEAVVKAVLMVALCCIQNKREMRPSMQTVVDMLEDRIAVELPPESHHYLL